MTELPEAAQGTFDGLADPEQLLEGIGKGLSHVKIRSLAEANRRAPRRVGRVRIVLVVDSASDARGSRTRLARGVTRGSR